ncbi:MAG: adhesin transport system membrane fusion protein [Cryomorphaceae bacterium]|jgi:adhesin transport system membrane fusion protein
MLNLSDNRIDESKYRDGFSSLMAVSDRDKPIKKLRIFLYITGGFIAFLFLPWTQNVRAPGQLTTLYPEQRPQTIQSVIPGRIEKWYVREGNFVNVGDTIVRISEVKDTYFDPQLIERTETQISSKQNAAVNYTEKAEALSDQIDALTKSRVNKLEQAENKLIISNLKVTSDSIDYQAAQLDYKIANQRLNRMEELFEQGLKSLTDLESRRLNVQEAQAKNISAENKLLSSKNQLINAEIEVDAIDNEYAEKLSKAKSERNSALSTFYDTQAQVAKMENQLSNYIVRQSNYFITVPQDGYVTKTISKGIGETIKEGAEIVSIMPATYDFAVEMYIDPVDFPLLHIGNDVRLMFDGWPAIVFSGWPQLSNGTFGGEILAIDNFISPNGKYRILVTPDEEQVPWPEDLRVGTGSDGILLFKDVSLWYELWRQLNGFPPDYYMNLNGDNQNSNSKGGK